MSEAKINKQSIIAGAVGVLVALVVTAGFDLLGAGAESTIASNPKIIALETKIESLEGQLNAYQLGAATVHASQETKLDGLASGQDRILDILIGD